MNLKTAGRTVLALILTLVVLDATSVQASPIPLSEVLQTIVAGQAGNQSAQLTLRSISQNGSAPVSNVSTRSSSSADTTRTASSVDVSSSQGLIASGVTRPRTTGSGVSTGIQSQEGSPNVETINLGDISGTICDCGEIVVPGGFPKWPLLALAVPLAFIPLCCGQSHEIPTPTPPPVTPTPPPTPPPSVPEPASLLLLGTGLAGLAAGARRRRAAKQVAKKIMTMEEV